MLGASDLLVTLLYLLPVALVALLLVSEARRPRWLLPLVLASLPLFYIAHYRLMAGLQGWPSDAALPAEFRLLAYQVTEPDPQNGDDGQILIWALADGRTQPRVHRLAYDKGLHRSLVRAGQRQAEGRQQVGRRPAKPSTARPAQPGDGGPQVEFDDERPPALPAKAADS